MQCVERLQILSSKGTELRKEAVRLKLKIHACAFQVQSSHKEQCSPEWMLGEEFSLFSHDKEK